MKKGISLISIIITILIIVILAAVMIPSGIDKINSAKIASFDSNIITLKEEIDSYMALNNLEYPAKTDAGGNYIVYSINTNPTLLAEVTKKDDQNDMFYIIDLEKLKTDNNDFGVGKTVDDYYIVSKASKNIYYVKGTKIGKLTYYTKQNKGDGVVATVPTSAPLGVGNPNPPKLSAGMTAVKWDGSNWVNADSANTGNDWYDYSKGVNRWANIKLADGSMFVWIPRFTYRILSGEHTATAGQIAIHFSDGTIDETISDYKIHPAFYFGSWQINANAPMTKLNDGQEITGFWFAKFEASAANGGQGYVDFNGSQTYLQHGDKLQIKPGVRIWGDASAGENFQICREMQTKYSAFYGIPSSSSIIDTHLMKNSDWSAVSYLTYWNLNGSEPKANSYRKTETDKYGSSVDVPYTGGGASSTTLGTFTSNITSSTTQNVTGIYDMNGGGWEKVSAYVNNSPSNLTLFAKQVLDADRKYKDLLPVGVSVPDNSVENFSLMDKAYGMGIWEIANETSEGDGTTFTQTKYGWHNALIWMPRNNYPLVERGSAYVYGNSSGIFFLAISSGAPDPRDAFRPVIVVY